MNCFQLILHCIELLWCFFIRFSAFILVIGFIDNDNTDSFLFRCINIQFCCWLRYEFEMLLSNKLFVFKIVSFLSVFSLLFLHLKMNSILSFHEFIYKLCFFLFTPAGFIKCKFTLNGLWTCSISHVDTIIMLNNIYLLK